MAPASSCPSHVSCSRRARLDDRCPHAATNSVRQCHAADAVPPFLACLVPAISSTARRAAGSLACDAHMHMSCGFWPSGAARSSTRCEARGARPSRDRATEPVSLHQRSQWGMQVWTEVVPRPRGVQRAVVCYLGRFRTFVGCLESPQVLDRPHSSQGIGYGSRIEDRGIEDWSA